MNNTRWTRQSEGFYSAQVGQIGIMIQSELHTEIEGRGWQYFISYTNRHGMFRTRQGDVYSTLSLTKEYALDAVEQITREQRSA
jgi:hypothetical protein